MNESGHINSFNGVPKKGLMFFLLVKLFCRGAILVVFHFHLHLFALPSGICTSHCPSVRRKTKHWSDDRLRTRHEGTGVKLSSCQPSCFWVVLRDQFFGDFLVVKNSVFWVRIFFGFWKEIVFVEIQGFFGRKQMNQTWKYVERWIQVMKWQFDNCQKNVSLHANESVDCHGCFLANQQI